MKQDDVFKPLPRRHRTRRRPLSPYEDTRIGRRTGLVIPRIEPEEDGFESFDKLMLLCDKLYPVSVEDIMASAVISVPRSEQNRAGDHISESSNIVVEETKVSKIGDADSAQTTPVLNLHDLSLPSSASEVTLCEPEEAGLSSEKEYPATSIPQNTNQTIQTRRVDSNLI